MGRKPPRLVRLVETPVESIRKIGIPYKPRTLGMFEKPAPVVVKTPRRKERS